MTWVRLDDEFGEHPKIAALSDSALALFVTGLAYCNRNLTDGFIPHPVGHGQLRYCDGNTAPPIAELEAAGLWAREPRGWQVHDYAEYQWTREEIETKKEQKIAAGRAGGLARAQAAAKAPAEAVAKAPAKAPAQADALAESKPIPIPIPKPITSKSSSKTLVHRTANFNEFWAAYPRKQDKREAQKSFTKALKDGIDPETIIEGARRFAADPNREAAYTKLPTTWLNHGCWEDDPQPARTNGKGPDRATQIMQRALETREAERAAE